MTTLCIILIILTLLIFQTDATLTNCNSPSDNCICVWDLQEDNTRPTNGQYRKVPTPAPTDNAAQDTRQWIMDDVTQVYPPSTGQCSSYNKVFWNIDNYCSPADYWYVGEESNLNSCTRICFCNNDNTQDPASCPSDKFFCTDNATPNNQVSVTFGRCPLLTDHCTHIGLTAASPSDACNGIYIAADPPNQYDNEINIYTNVNASSANKWLYFDHYSQRWKCTEVYIPCTNDVIHYGGQDMVGTPDPFQTVVSTGSTWTVSGWGAVTATFECNPPTPAPIPVPTLATPPPSYEPSAEPSASPLQNPTRAPTDVPTKNPTRAPTFGPSYGPTRVPSGAPSDSPVTSAPSGVPSVSPTYMPSVSPSEMPVPSPTKNPLRTGETSPPSGAPTTTDPTQSPTTMFPSENPSVSPSDSTGTPSRSPLAEGLSHAPTVSRPLPTEKPSTITHSPSASPTTLVPTKSPLPAYTTTEEDEDGNEGHMMGRMGAINIVLFIAYLLFC